MHAKARAAPEDDEHVTNQVHQVTLVQLESTCFYTEHCKSWTLIRNGPLSEVVHQDRLYCITLCTEHKLCNKVGTQFNFTLAYLYHKLCVQQKNSADPEVPIAQLINEHAHDRDVRVELNLT